MKNETTKPNSKTCTQKRLNEIMDILQQHGYAQLAKDFMIYRSMHGEDSALEWLCSIIKIGRAMQEEKSDEK